MQMMAEQDEKLTWELKNIFPLAPDWVLADTIHRCNKSRDQCIWRLRHEGYTPNPNLQNDNHYPANSPPPPYPGIGSYVPARLSLQCENGGKKTRFTFVSPQDPPPAYPSPTMSKQFPQSHRTETQQVRMTVSYNQTRRTGAAQHFPAVRVPGPENGLATTPSEVVRHKTSMNFTPIAMPTFESTNLPDESSSSSKISSINVYIDPPTYQQRPPMLVPVAGANRGGGQRRELRPAPAPPVPNPASPTTPNAVRRRAPPRPPPPVVGAWRQSPSPSPSPTAVTLFECKDPEQDNVLHKPIQPTVSPKVSPSIDTNKALLDLVERDESGYIQALLLHQKERLEQFRREFEQVKSRLESARLETAIVEQEQYERRKRNRSHSLTSLEELQKLREENQRLRFECDCMTREVDFLHKGQVPLGETNEEFYESIHTGQAGLVLPGPSTSTSVAWASPAEARRVSVAANGPGTSSCGRGCDEEAGKWSCSRCTFCNDSALDLCEICGMLRFGRVTPATAAGRG